jgi:hypothetical protein
MILYRIREFSSLQTVARPVSFLQLAPDAPKEVGKVSIVTQTVFWFWRAEKQFA